MNEIQKRFDELAAMAERIAASRKHVNVQKPSMVQYLDAPTNYYTESQPWLDGELLVEWRTSVLSLLSRVFGKESTTCELFQNLVKANYEDIHSYFMNLRAVFKSATSDFEGGYLFNVRNLVHAAVFTDELDQAKHFLDSGYKVPAAVIAGTVLETTLRELCEQNPKLTPADNINKMNDDLAKEAAFNASRKKQVTAWAAIRNSAAHGKPEEFEPGEVDRMIDGVRDFIANALG